jgi:DNA-directed RNA polymerase subunit RPC12/RpoP
MNDMNARPARQLFDVSALNLKCVDCGADITQLPFQPSLKEDGTYGRIYCRDCNRKRKSSF